MRYDYALSSMLLLATVSSFLLSCNQPTLVLGSRDRPLPAPSRSLPASQIMMLEGITSIHYVEYYHVTINGRADTGFTPHFEFHIDRSRIRANQYYLGTPDWNISVYDLKNNIAWNYYAGILSYPVGNPSQAYEGDVKAFLGGWLGELPTYVRSEYIDDKFCDVFTDSTGTLEWVWREHRLPLQRRLEWTYDNLYQITYRRYKILEINVEFPDSLFAPPI